MSDSDEDLQSLLEKNVPRRSSPSRVRSWINRFQSSITLPRLAAFGAGALVLYFAIVTFIFPSTSSHSLDETKLLDESPFAATTVIETHILEVTATKTVPWVETVIETPTGVPLPFDLAHDGLLDMSLDELREMVSKTNGYFVRDWSLGLGWNNVGFVQLRCDVR